MPPPSASCARSGAAARPLAGLRIIDFTAFWAGPFATQFLAAMGADVIKVESIQRPDGMRFQSVQPPTDDGWWEWGALYQTVNLGKRGITLDLGRPAGVELVKRLLADADAVVENFSPRVMDNLGLDYGSSPPATRASSWCACRRSASTGRGAIASASRRRWSRSPAWRG